MRIVFILTLFLSSLSAVADDILLESYSFSVQDVGHFIVYSHDVLDAQRVPRFVLWKTVKPTYQNGKPTEKVTYAIGVKDSKGQIINEEFISPERYKQIQKRIESAKTAGPLLYWDRGCQIRLVTTPENALVNLMSLCSAKENPAIEAGSSELVP